MSKNIGKAGKNRKNTNDDVKRELLFKEDGQEYGQVTEMLGDSRLNALCFDGVTRLCKIRGKFRNKVWINQGDIILLGLRDFQDYKADVIYKYYTDEARRLKSLGEIPESTIIDTFDDGGLDDGIRFEEISEDEDINGI